MPKRLGAETSVNPIWPLPVLSAPVKVYCGLVGLLNCLLPDSVMAGERSIVEYFAEHEHYRCGYCGNSDTNYSHG